MIHARAHNQSGSVAPLMIGLFLIVATLTAVVIDASAGYLQRHQLNSIADSAALVATDGLASEQLYLAGVQAQLTIDPDVARARVNDYLRRSGAVERFPGLTWRMSTTATSVTVVVAAPLQLPLGVPGIASSAPVRAAATASVQVVP